MAKRLLDGSDVECETFTDGHSFLEAVDVSRPGCVVLEQRIPDMSGFQVLRRLAAGGFDLPAVFVLGCPNVSMAVELMRSGAVHVLEKPLRSIELLNTIQEALELDENRRTRSANESRLRELVARLTRKEREVLELVGLGRSVKSIAAQLDLTVRAVEQRRRGLMEKLSLHSPLELLRFSMALKQSDGLPLAIAGVAMVEPSSDRPAPAITIGNAHPIDLRPSGASLTSGLASSSFAFPADEGSSERFAGLADAVATAVRRLEIESMRSPRLKPVADRRRPAPDSPRQRSPDREGRRR